MDTHQQTSPQNRVASIRSSIVIAVATLLMVGLDGCKKAPTQTESTTQPHAPEITRNDDGPSDEIIKKFASGPRGNFKRGSTMVSNGGRVPAGTLLFPVRSEPDPYSGYYRYYFFRDEFGDWKLMRQEGERKVQIFSPKKNAG